MGGYTITANAAAPVLSREGVRNS